MAAARGIDVILPTTATSAVALAALGQVQRHERSFGGFRLSPNDTNPLGRGLVAREAHIACETHEAQNFQTTFDCHTAVLPHQPHLKRALRNRLG